MQLIDGKATAAAIKEQIAQEVAQIVAAGGKQPHLVAVLVGHDGGSETYVKNKVLACEKCGFKSTLIRFEEDVTEEDFDAMLGINLKGTVFMTKYAVLQMKKQGTGNIVNISSDAGIHGNMLCSSYCASKGGVNMFTKAMALELGPYGIRINAVCPGDVLTPLTEAQLKQYPDRQAALQEMASVYPIGRIATVDEVAEIVYFLAGSKASFVNGALWSVDGGLT